MFDFLYSLIAFLIVLTLLITVHELGHFWMARLAGVKVIRFSIGFGKPLYRWMDKKGTEYVIAAIPFGGYVKMLDEKEQKVSDEDLSKAYNRKPILSRMAIIIAGPLFNWIFAILAFWLLFSIGISRVIPIIGDITPHSIAANAKLTKGYEIHKIDDEKITSWNDFHIEVLTRLGDETLYLQIKNPQTTEIENKQLDIRNWQPEDRNLLGSLGINPYMPTIKPAVAKVQPNTPAAKAGFKPGDTIEKVNGEAVEDWQKFAKYVQSHPQRFINVEVTRGTGRVALELIPEEKVRADGTTYGFIGLQPISLKWPDSLMRTERYGVFSALKNAIDETANLTSATFVMIGKLITGQISPRHISGPIGIAQGAGQSASVGFVYYLAFMAIISISLAVLNSLPVPMLDGGQLLFLIVEMLRGKPVSENTQVISYAIGLFLIILLMGIALYNDISRLFLQFFG